MFGNFLRESGLGNWRAGLFTAQVQTRERTDGDFSGLPATSAACAFLVNLTSNLPAAAERVPARPANIMGNSGEIRARILESVIAAQGIRTMYQ